MRSRVGEGAGEGGENTYADSLLSLEPVGEVEGG